MATLSRQPGHRIHALPDSASGWLASALLGLALLLLAGRLLLTPAVGLPLNFLMVFLAASAAGLVGLYSVLLAHDRGLLVLAGLVPGLLAATWLVAELVGGGGGTPQLTLGPGDSGRTITVSQGTQLMIQLPANPSTGYGWQATISDPSVLKESDAVFKPSSGALGADGVYTVWYQAVGSGRSDLRLAYQRSWEAGVPPIQVFEAVVVVR